MKYSNETFKSILVSGFTILLAAACTSGNAQAQGGAVPIRISLDGVASRCINPRTDQVWLTLRRLIVNKSKTFLKKDRSVAVVMNTSVKQRSPEQQKIVFPLIAEANLSDYTSGQVSVPIEYTIVDGLRLKQDETIYSALGIDVTIINKSGKTGWGRALETLLETAEKLPIPASPAKEAASYLLDFANTTITKEIKDQNDSDKYKSASLAVNFDPTGKCEGGMDSGFAHTGTIAVLHENGIKDDANYVNIGKVNEYCWSAELRPAFVLKKAKKIDGADCGDPKYDDRMADVSNNYYAFFLNAVGGSEVLGPAREEDRTNSINRCIANNIDKANCF